LHRAAPHGLESQKGCPSTAASAPMCRAISIRANAKWAVSVLPANHCTAPKCHTPSHCGCTSFGEQCPALCSGKAAAQASRSRGESRHCLAARRSSALRTKFEGQGHIAACPTAVRAALTPMKLMQNAANHSVKASAAMQRPSISNETQAFVFSTPSTTLTSLTVSSSGTRMLRIRAPQLGR
jgi:hypothetical protein